MPNKHENYSMQDAMRLASTPAGQQLIALLKASGGNSLEQAQKHMKSGNMEQARASLSEVLSSPKVQQLLRELEKGHG